MYAQITNEGFPTSRTETTTENYILDDQDISYQTSGITGFITNGLGANTNGNSSNYSHDGGNLSLPSQYYDTISFLIHLKELPTALTPIIYDDFNGINIKVKTNGAINVIMNRASGSDVDVTSTTLLSLNTTYRVSVVFNFPSGVTGSGGTIYINGVAEDNDVGNNASLDISGSQIFWKMYPGCFVNMVSYIGVASTATQLLHEYQMYSSNASYYVVGSEETIPTFIDIYEHATAVYQKSLTDTAWSETTITIPIKVLGRDPIISPIYASYGDQGTVNFFASTPTNSFVDMYQAGNTADLIEDLTFVDFNYPTICNITYDSGIDNKQYFSNNINSLNRLNGSTFTANVFTAFPVIQNVQNYNGYMTFGGYKENTGQSYIQIWDRADTVATQSVDMGLGKLRIVGNVKGTLFGVINNFIDGSNQALGSPSMDVRIYTGSENYSTTHRISVPTTMDSYYTETWEQPVSQLKGTTKNSVIFYAKIPADTNGNYHEGLWAVGKNEVSDKMALCLLYETNNIGDVYNLSTLANQCVVFSNTDQVYRVNPTPLYSAVSSVETRIFNDGNSETVKRLMGVEVMHESLDSGQTYSVYKKSNTDTDYVLIMTSDTAGTISKENTVDMNGDAMGEFKEIQFKITTTGGNAGLTEFSFKYETLLTNV